MGEQESVWRVCHAITGECRRCPERELLHGEDYMRGCYMQAVECINVVETGNPWRKTSGVRAPWVATHTSGADEP